MHLSYLREYVALARYMNISKASRELHMTQSNLSKHIRQIELEVGADLVSHGNRLEFTPAGFISSIRRTRWSICSTAYPASAAR